MVQEILRFERVSYAYEAGIDALTDVSLAVCAGEKIAVLGNNGAGKSTLFLLANGVLVPRAGQVILEEVPVGRNGKALQMLRRGVGLVFQDPDVQILAGSVEEEISFGPMNLNLDRPEVVRRVDEAIEQFDLAALRTRAPQYLSGGEKKRVTLADATAMEPKLLLLDEPAASLDPANSRLLEQTLATLSSRGLALMIATHDVDFAWRWADRVLLFHAGRLVADCAPEAAFAQEAWLKQCGLEQPTLYRVGKILGLARIPRTVQELQQQELQQEVTR